MLHLDEVRPGEGAFDHGTRLTELAKPDADLPVMLARLSNAEDNEAAASVRMVAKNAGVPF